METKKWIYLYRITLVNNESCLYYFGIRTYKGNNVCDDPYMGSPKTNAHIWKDSSYTKHKDIIRADSMTEETREKLAALEIHLIKSAWKKYGVFGKDDCGRCLNASAGRHHMNITESFREKMTMVNKKRWENPEYKEKMKIINSEVWKDPERRASAAERAKEQWKDEKHYSRRSSEVKEQWKDPIVREKMSNGLKEMWKNPEYRAKRAENRIKKQQEKQ